jgi:uncharacterized protein (DUF488 family)
MEKPVIYTIGHSTHPLDYFLELLNTYAIDFLADVRSVAASSYNPQYNQQPLSQFLNANGIVYHHFPEAFGARHSAPEMLDEESKVNFDLVRESINFKKGIEDLTRQNQQGHKVVLMCSESDPMECHRFSMISIALQKNGFDVLHILKDNTILSNVELEHQLLKKYAKKIPQPDLFQPHITVKDQLIAAYRLHNKEVAYAPFSKLPAE